VFVNTDSTDYPLQVPGWTVQSAPTPASVYIEPHGQEVFSDAKGNGPLGKTPANAWAWTTQQVNSGLSS